MPKLWPVILLTGTLAATATPAGASQFIDVGTVVPGLVADIRYAGSHNFVGRPIDGYRARRSRT